MYETKVEELAVKVEELVRERGGGVSFVELEKLEGFTPAEGEEGVGMWVDKYNLLLWQPLTQLAIDALSKLIAQDRIVWTRWSIWLTDGKAMTLPVAKKADHCYAKPRWAPVVFDPDGAKV